MKKHLLTLFVIAPLYIFAQQTYTWSTSSGSWSVATNWSPQRTIPSADDILEFNTPATITDLPVAETVGKIRVYNNAVITFTASAASIITIGNASVSAPHFAVEAGASLTYSGASNIILNLSSGFTGQIDGNVSFAGAEHRLTATTTNAIIFSSGAVFTADAGFSGNAFGDKAANANTVTFQSGATYIYKDGGNPFGLSAPNTITVFNSGSIYRHQANGVGPSVAGRTYGHLYIEANVNFSGIGSVNNCTIQNDLNILSGFFSFKPNSLGSHTGNFNIYGNILASGTSTISIGSPNMPGAVQLLGTNQIIGGGGGTGSIIFDRLIINNANSATLQRPVTVTGTLGLQSGKIVTSTAALLSVIDTTKTQSCPHNYFNLPYSDIGCDISYVEGPMRKLGLAGKDFVFPVGINGKLRPAAVRNATGDFTVEFVRGDPYIDISSTMGAGIHHTSHLEYWNITSTGTANIELSFFDPNSGGVTDMNALRVARFDGSAWANQGISSYLGSPGANGSVTSNPVTGFGSFSLAGALGYPNNPLPVNSIIFNAFIRNENVVINWVVDNETPYKCYIVERASVKGIYNQISPQMLSQEADNHNYVFIDTDPWEGENLYRLKLVKWDGEVIYSDIKPVQIKVKSEILVYPNPVREKIFIKIPKSSSISKIGIVHISGSVIKWLTAGNQTTVTVDITDLVNGVYYIKIIQPGSSTCVPFVKY